MKCHFCGVELDEAIFLACDKCPVCEMTTRMAFVDVIKELRERITKLETELNRVDRNSSSAI